MPGRAIQLSIAEFRACVDPDAARSAAASRQARAGDEIESLIERACAFYREHDFAEFYRFKPDRIVVRGRPMWKGKGRPDFFGAYAGRPRAFDVKDVTGCATFVPRLEDGRNSLTSQLDTMDRLARHGGYDCFLLLYDRHLRVGDSRDRGALWILRDLDAVRRDERISIRGANRAGRELVHYLPVIGPASLQDVARRRMPIWPFLLLLDP